MKFEIVVLSVLVICCLQQANALEQQMAQCFEHIDKAMVDLKPPFGLDELYILVGAPIIQTPEEHAKMEEKLRKECTLFVAEGAKILSTSLCGTEVPNFLRSSEGEAESQALERFTNLDTYGKQMSICVMFRYSEPPRVDGLACPRSSGACKSSEAEDTSEDNSTLDSEEPESVLEA